MPRFLKKMGSSERLRYLPEEEEEAEEEKEDADNAVICWSEEPAVWDAPREEEPQNSKVLEVKGKGHWASADTRNSVGDIELFVNEMLRRKKILTGASRKRKASVSRCRGEGEGEGGGFPYGLHIYLLSPYFFIYLFQFQVGCELAF